MSTRELGLVLAMRLLKPDDLHYGYWVDGLDVTLANLPKAQAHYCEYLFSKIPPDVHTLLDVGCGTGHIAEQLIGRGYQVECVSPSALLTEMARKRLGESTPIHKTTFEALDIPWRFDLLLFSESFQYIAPVDSLPKAHQLLNPGGYLLLSDFFCVDAQGESALHGGHRLESFRHFLASQPFRVVSDEDITARTAPNLKVADDLLRDYAMPVWDTLALYLRENRPWLVRLTRPFLRKKLEKLHFKYFSGRRNAEAFARYKSYRCILLQRT